MTRVEQLFDKLPLRQTQPPPQTSVFYLHPQDDLSSVLDRLDWAEAKRLILVVPLDAPVLTDRLDLLRVRRHAARRHVGVALVTPEPEQRAIARELGIPTFNSIERAQHSHWRHPAPPSPPSRRDKAPDPETLRPSDSRVSGHILLGMSTGVLLVLIYDLVTFSQIDVKLMGQDALIGAAGGAAVGLLVFLLALLGRRFAPRALRWVQRGLMTLVFVLGLLSPLVAGYAIVPGARLTVTPARRYISAVARITVVVPSAGQQSLETIDFEGQRIAGRRVSAEVGGTAVAAATGTSDVPSSRATGAIVFSNLRAQEYTVGQGTIVRTSAGTPVRFATSGDVTVPPMGQAAIGIEALEPGPQGNVNTGQVNRVEGAAALSVRVTNPEPTQGGGVSQVRAVTQADREALRGTLLAELREQGYERVLERPEEEGGLRQGEHLVQGSVRLFQVLHETFDRFSTEEAESVKLEMRVSVTGVVVDLADAYNLARHVLERRVLAGYELIGVRYQPGLMGDNVIGDGTLTFFVEAEGIVEARPEYERVKTQLQGKPFQEGMALLDAAWQRGELPITAPPEAEIWPTWAEGRFPWLIWRIEIVEQDSTEALSGAPDT